MECKVIYTEQTFSFESAEVGDLVTEGVVDYFMDVLPPASYTYDCAQLGEPYSAKLDDKACKHRQTYLTFRCIGNGVWMYCGKCFRGENVERGEEISYA